MEFLQPNMLWGTLALAIPVIIHFWYQKKGKVIEWAATQWLTDKTKQQHRGLRLDELALLLIRCLLVILLVLLLSKPILEWLNSNQTAGEIHLVEPNQRLVDNYRFELQKAINDGEKVFWIGPGQETIKNISVLPSQINSSLYLQESISKQSGNGKTLHIYVQNNSRLATLPQVYVPGSFKLHTAIDSAGSVVRSYIDLGEGKKLYVDKKYGEAARLKVADGQGSRFEPGPAHAGNIKILVDYKNDTERQTVQAALLALSEVYSFPFEIEMAAAGGKKYDLLLTDQTIKFPDPSTLYVVQQKNNEQSPAANVIYVQDSLRLQTSGMVQNGQLPEWLGDLIISHFKLNENLNPLSQKQLDALFVNAKPLADPSADQLHQWLLLLFVMILILERWVALKKNLIQTYA